MPILKEELQHRYQQLTQELGEHVSDEAEFDRLMDVLDQYVELCCAVVLDAWESQTPKAPHVNHF